MWRRRRWRDYLVEVSVEAGGGEEEKELAKEAQELRAAQDWINQDGWDASSEGVAWSPRSGTQIIPRLEWGKFQRNSRAAQIVMWMPSQPL